jgi:hypothetical protein
MTNWLWTSTVSRRALWVIGLSLIMLGCSPKYDWREIRNDDFRWKALFPDKPVSVTRTFTPPNAQTSVSLTLQSSRIDDSLFAIGSIPDGSPTTAKELESVMLANIAATPASIYRSVVQKHGQTFTDIKAVGVNRSSENKDQAVLLWMRTITIAPEKSANIARDKPNKSRVIEIIVIRPAHQRDPSNAELFMESFRLLD